MFNRLLKEADKKLPELENELLSAQKKYTEAEKKEIFLSEEV